MTTIRESEFKVGDEVEFELSNLDSMNRPRWDNGIVENTGSGRWTGGFVESVDLYKIVVNYTIEGYVGTGVCEWPNILNIYYNPAQWNYPGYLRKKKLLKCECGSEKIYGSKSPHSYWCPKYR